MLVAGGGERMPSENNMKMETYKSIIKRQTTQLKMGKTTWTGLSWAILPLASPVVFSGRPAGTVAGRGRSLSLHEISEPLPLRVLPCGLSSRITGKRELSGFLHLRLGAAILHLLKYAPRPA